jgi:hypothetical protein
MLFAAARDQLALGHGASEAGNPIAQAHTRRISMRRVLVSRAIMIVGVVSLAAAPALAQEASGRGFLFGAPKGSISSRGGYSAPSAGSDVFSFVTEELTLGRGDFGSFSAGADVSVAVTNRFDIVVSLDAGGMERKSEFRDWLDNSGNPIEQHTSFSRQTFALGGKYYLIPPGRSLGRLAWVPSAYAPWISAGAGRTLYNFSQSGDFIDFDKGNSVFRDSFRSTRWTTTLQFAAGLDWSLNQRFAFTTQAKYLWGRADLSYDYAGFDPIDLSGVGLSAGLTLRF